MATRPIPRFDFTPARLREALLRDGVAAVKLAGGLGAAAAAPWSFCEDLLGERPLMVERQPIRPRPGGRSFSSGTAPAPFHTDSQRHLGAPPDLQLMLCLAAADRGGESRYLDSWALLGRLEREEPALFRALFEVYRRIPFVFGDFFGTTASARRGSLVFTHSAIASGDPVASRLAPHLDAEPAYELKAEPGELLAIHNHRLLHGRRGFEDPKREFVRLLVWLRAPLPSPARYLAYAEEVAAAARLRLAGHPRRVRERLGLEAEPRGPGAERLEIVLELLRGTPPGVLAAKHQVPEAELYRWREAALSAARDALGDEPLAGGDTPAAMERALEELRGLSVGA
jgi:hypothetical protein